MKANSSLGVFVETACSALLEARSEKHLKSLWAGVMLQWPGRKGQDWDLAWVIIPRDDLDRRAIVRLREAYEIRLADFDKDPQRGIMRWSAGERDPGSAELCSANKGEWDWDRNDQERDADVGCSELALVKAVEKNFGRLSRDKERFAVWHKALRDLVRVIRTKDARGINRRVQVWSKACTQPKKFYSTPKTALLLYSWRIRTQLVLKHISYDQWLSLGEKVARVFIYLNGGKGQTPSEKGLPERDQEVIDYVEHVEAWDYENWDNLGATQDWVPDSGLTPEEELISQECEMYGDY